jgi:hypothetical protein
VIIHCILENVATIAVLIKVAIVAALSPPKNHVIFQYERKTDHKLKSRCDYKVHHQTCFKFYYKLFSTAVVI